MEGFFPDEGDSRRGKGEVLSSRGTGILSTARTRSGAPWNIVAGVDGLGQNLQDEFQKNPDRMWVAGVC